MECRKHVLPSLLVLSLSCLVASFPVFGSPKTVHFSADDLLIGPEEVGSVSVGGDVILNGTGVLGNVTAGGMIKASGCSIQGVVMSGADTSLNSCEFVTGVTAGKNVTLYNSMIQKQVRAGNNLYLVNATVHGNIAAAGDVLVEDSKLYGTLVASDDHLVVKGSEVANIRITHPVSSVSSNRSSGIIVNGSVRNATISSNGVMMTSHPGGSVIAVGPGSMSNVNGFSVKSTLHETTLITPDGTIFVNGNKVFGAGPKSYAEFRRQNQKAPQVKGPGWDDEGVFNQPPELFMSSATGQQIVELSKNSIITGKITFESGNGKVIINPGSQFQGTVEGGVVETATR